MRYAKQIKKEKNFIVWRVEQLRQSVIACRIHIKHWLVLKHRGTKYMTDYEVQKRLNQERLLLFEYQTELKILEQVYK